MLSPHCRAHLLLRKTRDGKQRFAVPDGEFGKCIFLNDVSIDELRLVLKTHKQFVKSRFGSGNGQEAYVDSGDLGAEPEAYAKGDAGKSATGHGKITAGSLKKNGIANGHQVSKAAVQAGGVPVDSTGHVTNGVSGASVRLYRSEQLMGGTDQINGTSGN